MTWRDNLRPASFRGAGFQVEGHEFDTGRRGHQHEYPLRDKPLFEDLGRRAAEFAVEGFIIGNNYMQERDALIRACEQEGPGTLVHPYLGTRQVVCAHLKVIERIAEGRMCRLQMQFVEAGENLYPSVGRDYNYTINQSADAAGRIAVDDFANHFNVAGLPDFVANDALGVLEDIASLAAGLSGGGYSVSRAIDALLSLGPAGLRSSLLVGQRILGLAQAFRADYSGRPDRTATALRTLSQYSVADRVSDIPLTTTTRHAQAQNINLLGGLITRVGLIEEGRTFPERSFDSYQAAMSAAQDYADRMDESHRQPGGTTDEVYQALVQLQADVVEYVAKQAADLPQLREYVLPTDMPALAVAYELYEDARKDEDIVRRNGLRDPSAVPGGTPLEVLQP